MGKEQAQLPIGHKIHAEEGQEPIPYRNKCSNPYDPPNHLIMRRRRLSQCPMEPTYQKVTQIFRTDIRPVREEENQKFIIVQLARQLCDPPFDRRRHQHLLWTFARGYSYGGCLRKGHGMSFATLPTRDDGMTRRKVCCAPPGDRPIINLLCFYFSPYHEPRVIPWSSRFLRLQ